MIDEQTPVTPGERLAQLAATRPDDTAIVVGMVDGPDATITWAGLEAASNRLARTLTARGVDTDSFVAIVLPTGIEHVIATFAALKLGACPMPVNAAMPAPEREAMLDLASRPLVIGDVPGAALSAHDVMAAGGDASPPARYVDPNPYKAIGSGGSTGRPEVIVADGGWCHPVGGHPLGELSQVQPDDVVYLTGPLYHNQAFLFAQLAFFTGATVVLNERFRPETAFRLIADHRVTVLNTVPTVMLRMLRHDPEGDQDLSSLRLMWHMAAMCPEWVKLGWIERLGAERVLELWGATEVTGLTTIRGDEWLTRRGSVGRGYLTEALVLDQGGNALPPGEVGELHTRFAGGPPTYRYLGAEQLPVTDDGFCSVGDLAWLDEDGYVYLADRRVDLIITGGSNVYPAEVEAVLSTHAGVADVAVIGLSDPDLGRTVHAIVQPANPIDPPSTEALSELCAQHLTRYKVPRSIEIVASLPRDDAGKIRRAALRDARDHAHLTTTT